MEANRANNNRGAIAQPNLQLEQPPTIRRPRSNAVTSQEEAVSHYHDGRKIFGDITSKTNNAPR